MAGHNGNGHTANNNIAPVLAPVADQTVPEKVLLHVEITASDADNENLIFDPLSLPPGAVFQQNTTTQAYFKWLPDYTEAGTYEVRYKVRDEFVAKTDSFLVNVTDVNRPPYLDVIRNDWIYELSEFDVQLKAHDPDVDNDLSYSLESIPTPDHNSSALPAGVRFADGGNNDAAFAWTPDCTQGAPFDPLLGGGKRYQFRVNVTDGQLNHSRQFNLTVYHVDSAPALHTQPFRLALEGTTLAFQITAAACDVENHTLEVGLVRAVVGGITPPPLPSPLPNQGLPVGVTVDPEHPANMTYDPITAIYSANFTWNITFQQAGNYTFYSKMADWQGNSDNKTFIIKVVDENTAPVFNLLPDLHAGADGYWAKEDTRFNMTAPLGFYAAEHPGAGATWTNGAQRFDCFSGAVQIPCGDTLATPTGLIPEACANDPFAVCVDAGLPTYPTGFTCDWANITYPLPCGTPWVARVADAENDTIFWGLQWLKYNGGTPFSPTTLPAGLRFIAPGTNWTTGTPNNATPALPAPDSFAFIDWIPNYDQAGTYEFRLFATDGIALAEHNFTIKVENTNRRPVLPAPQSFVVHEDTELVIPFQGQELDFLDKTKSLRDDIAFTAGNIPPGAEFASGKDESSTFFHGTFRWVPGFHQSGFYTVTLRANDTDTLRLFPTNPLGYGNAIDQDLYLEAPFVQPTPWVDGTTLTEFSNTTWFNITVLNVDRAPVLDPIPDVSYQAGATVNLLVHAEDADGDLITLSILGNPAATGLVIDSSVPGEVDARVFGTAVTGGVHTVTVEACAGFPLACTTETFRLIIIVDTDFEMAPTQPIFDTSPGVDVVIPILVSNTGPANPDMIVFSAAMQNGILVNVPNNVTANATSSEWANVTVRLPAGVAEGTLRLTGTSLIDPSLSKIIQVKVRAPVQIQITMTSTTPGLISAVANVTFLDGSGVPLVPITATQSPATNPFGQLSSSVSGQTANDGLFTIDFSGDARASLPGSHTLTASVVYGGRTFSASTPYTPGA